MKTIAYLRVSTNQQEMAQQKYAILEYCDKSKILVDEYIELQMSTRKSVQEASVHTILDNMEANSRFIVSELSRLGRSLGQIICFIDSMVKKKIHFVSVKEKIDIQGPQDIQSKVMITLFGLFAEVERDLISSRTKQALATVKLKGKNLGRPKGSKGNSRLDKHEEEIKYFLKKEVSVRAISKILDIPYTTLCSFVKSRRLKKVG